MHHHTQADLARQHRTYTTAYYKGEADTGGSVLDRLKTTGPSLKEFLWYSSIVRTGNGGTENNDEGERGAVGLCLSVVDAHAA